MPIEVPADELVDFSFALSMKVLEFVHSLELDDIEAIWKNAIRLPLEKVLGFVCGDVRNGGEDVGAVGS